MKTKHTHLSGRSKFGLLRRMAIGKKLALLIVICLLSFASFFVVAQVGLNTVRIGGDIYSDIIDGKDLIADILPPPAYIIESYLIAQQMYHDIGTSAVNEEIERCNTLKKEYDARHAFWQENLEGDELRSVFLTDSYNPAIKFYEVLFNEYISAITNKDKDLASQLLNNDMKNYYEAHRAAIDKVVTMANERNAKDFAYSEQVLQTTQFIELLVALALFILSIVTGVLIARSISIPIRATAKCAHALSRGNLDEALEITSRDEVGELAAIIGTNVRNAFKEIEHARVVADKKAQYQSEEASKLLQSLQRLAEGDLSCELNVSQADADTADLHELFTGIGQYLGRALAAIKGYISQITDVLGEMANGNLDVGIKQNYHGDFIALKESINGIADSLNSVLGDIRTAADQVATGTQQVSHGNQLFSFGATEQAGAIVELTASVSQIAQQTRQNAQNAVKANELTAEAAANAQQGNEQMQAMQQAMEQIYEASHNIDKINKVIDDIAFQTNILALNAAVEAARAGIHGKGFAVVAQEVRNLAARSTAAAKETTELIERCIQKTDSGAKIAANTADAFRLIVDGVGKAAQHVSEIAALSSEQASAIAQVNDGIEQMSVVVQNNTAATQQTAATAQELFGQAELLKDMVGKFTVRQQENPLNSTEARLEMPSVN